MSNWKGYFLKAISSNKKFPNRYIDWASWDATPNQREEIIAYRDDNTRDLHRVTASGKKSVFSFSTRPNLKLAEVEEILDFFTDSESDASQRKIQLEYWNDETLDYKTGYFYRPNMKFKIIKATGDNLWYDSLNIECIEY